MTFEQVEEIVKNIQYKPGWRFHVEGMEFLQVCFVAEDAIDPGKPYFHHGRKWKLSRHMTKSEVVQTCLMAILAAEEHETRELFTYKGKAIFAPHFDVEQLVELCDTPCLDVRLEAVK